MRFIVEEVLLSSIHPQWPGAVFFKIKDTKLGRYRLGMYTIKKVGNEALELVKAKFSV